jgi:hypothetical protein
MKLFTVLRNSGFGDYVGTTRVLSAILGSEYKYVVCNQLKYSNYHCKNLDFINLFFNGDYVDFEPQNIINISFRDLLNQKTITDHKLIALTIDNQDFSSFSKFGRLDITPTQSLFTYKPTNNPFLESESFNKVTLHLRETDLVSANKLIRPMINPLKINNFINNLFQEKTDITICSDTAQNSSYHNQIKQLSFSDNIRIIDTFIGKDTETTIKTMDAIYYSDTTISKSSSFIHLFNTKKITVPDEFCYKTFEEIKI